MSKLSNKIINQIKLNKGYLTLDEFINISMYDVHYGYYINKNPIGKEGDFITSSEISQLFGELIGLYIFDYWKNYINKDFSLIELGPGRGTFLIDLLRISSRYEGYLSKLNLKLIEKNKILINFQKRIFQNLKNIKSVEWSGNINISNNENVIFFSNEFFDCFPIKQFFKYKNNYFEKIVKYNKKNNSFFLDNLKINNNKFTNIIDNIYFLNKLYDESIVEISPQSDNYIKNISNIILKNKGMIVIIDYGSNYCAGKSTIQSIKQHKKTNFLLDPGEQDITHMIDFSYFKNYFKAKKLNVYGPFSQRDFFLSLGIIKYKNIIINNSSAKQKNIIESGYERLIGNKYMGKLFKILIISSRKLDQYEK